MLAAMLSTRNLIVNGGFSRQPADAAFGWHLAPDAWRRIAVADADRNGIPHSAYASVLAATETGSAARLSQEVAITNVATRRFAVRLAARAAAKELGGGLIACVRSSPGGETVCRMALRAAAEWQRQRAAFDVPEGATGLTLEVALQDGTPPGHAVAITDVRLVGLLRPLDDIAIRFDTSSDMQRASSRLRAFMLEDYLHLIGCRTSINRGRDFDLYVCQKVRPWLRLAKARLARKQVIFDLDDNDLLISRWRAANTRGFARAADAVSVGSEFLRDMAANWNSRVFLLDNPVDILDPDLMRGDRPWQERLVWFGMPENRWMLDRLGLERPVTVITKGGTVEYALKSIDEQLVASDLALLPVSLNAETRAKNANRLVKCVGLGLPFLASDTEEHRRAARLLRLPEDCLVTAGQDWAARIDAVGRDYARYRRMLQDARARAFALYGVERIAADWLQFCAGPLRAKAGP